MEGGEIAAESHAERSSACAQLGLHASRGLHPHLTPNLYPKTRPENRPVPVCTWLVVDHGNSLALDATIHILRSAVRLTWAHTPVMQLVVQFSQLAAMRAFRQPVMTVKRTHQMRAFLSIFSIRRVVDRLICICVVRVTTQADAEATSLIATIACVTTCLGIFQDFDLYISAITDDLHTS